MTETMPALAVTTLLQDRATARARWPTRGGAAAGASAGASRPATAKNREARRRIPAGELGIERLAVVTPHVQAVLAPERADGRQDHVVRIHEPARRPAASLHLDDRR